MRHWGFWDRVAYACLLVGAVIMAADTGIKLSPDLAALLPSFVNGPLWGFAPLCFVLIATIILLYREFRPEEDRAVQKSHATKIPKGLEWFSGYDAIQLADQQLLQRHKVAREKYEKLQSEMNNLAKEWMDAKDDLEKAKDAEDRRDKLNPLLNAALNESEKLWTECWSSVQQLLADGSLIAKGFKKPIDDNPQEIIIPAEYWRFLVFSDSYKGAQGVGRGYTGIVIARRV